jgi:hypothetical protein
MKPERAFPAGVGWSYRGGLWQGQAGLADSVKLSGNPALGQLFNSNSRKRRNDLWTSLQPCVPWSQNHKPWREQNRKNGPNAIRAGFVLAWNAWLISLRLQHLGRKTSLGI